MKPITSPYSIKLAILILSGCEICIAIPARAQGSVSLYGLLDAGVSYVNNAGGQHQYSFADGVYTGNRWGILGTEDLGGGKKAIFNLESGFTLGTGKALGGGAAFSRRAYVGLADNNLGTVTVGLQYDFINDFVAMYNVSGDATGYGSHQGDYDRMGTDRLPNAVKYVSPTFYGITFGAMYSFSNVLGNFHDGSGWSAGIRYANRPLTIGLAYTRLSGTATDPYAKLGVSSFLGATVATTNPVTGAVTDLYANGNFQLDYAGALVLGGVYDFGKAKVMANITQTTLKSGNVSSNLRVGEIGTLYNLTGALQGILAYQYTTFEHKHWHQFAAGLTYHLSKRTFVYGGIDYLRASSGVDPVIGGHFAPSTGSAQIDGRIAVLHKF